MARHGRGEPEQAARSPPALVVSGCYRYVRNPIYAGFTVVLAGQALLFGSTGVVEYAVVAWVVGAAAVRCYEEPVLTRKFGDEYRAYRRAVPAWVPRMKPWDPAAARTSADPGQVVDEHTR